MAARFLLPSYLLLVAVASALPAHLTSLPVFSSPDGFVAGCSTPDEFSYTSRAFQVVFNPREIQLHTKDGSARLTYQGANTTTAWIGQNASGSRVHLLLGRAHPACSNLPVFHSLSYSGLYEGIDVRFEALSSGLESEYRIAPRADPDRIRIAYQGALSMIVNAAGGLDLGMPHGFWQEQRPRGWQLNADGSHQDVSVEWRFRDDGSIGFRIGSYDHNRALVIDPAITYNTYISNATTSALSAATGVAVDGSGNTYIAGWIEGSNLGGSPIGQTANHGSGDAFLVKLNASGAVVFVTYFGGGGDDRALALALDSSGRPWITGVTSSYDLPVQSAFQASLNGSRNAFVASFSTAGSVVFASYLGGTGPDSGNGIAADSSGNVYVVGDTQSPNFPVRNAAQASYGGGQDAFIAKISNFGSPLYITFLGGSNSDHGAAIAVDSSGAAYVTGGTFSTNFPVTTGVLQPALKGSADAFVAKLNPSGSAFAFSTYLGGTSGSLLAQEQGNAIAVDTAGEAYVAGVTPSNDFPLVAALQNTYAGSWDAFVSKLNPAGTALTYSTYLGGVGIDVPTGIAVDHVGAICVTGYTSSPDFPSYLPTQTNPGGLYDAFVTIFNPQGSAYYYSTLMGGSGSDAANAVAIDTNGNILLAGQTSSLDYPLLNPLAHSHSGGIDAFVAKISTDDSFNFVERCYFGVLGGPPDPSGLNYWATQLNASAQTRKQVAMAFYDLSPVQNGGFYVIAAYFAVLGRDPDYGGYRYWAGIFNSNAFASPSCVAATSVANCSQLGLLGAFANSVEFQNRFAATDNTSFVTVVYQNVLGRQPDPGGLAYWVGSLNNGLTRAQLLQSFIVSPEFKNTFGNRVQTELAFSAFLLRMPTAAEIQTWGSTLSSNGGDVSALVNALITGAEFKSGL